MLVGASLGTWPEWWLPYAAPTARWALSSLLNCLITPHTANPWQTAQPLLARRGAGSHAKRESDLGRLDQQPLEVCRVLQHPDDMPGAVPRRTGRAGRLLATAMRSDNEPAETEQEVEEEDD